MYFMRKLRKFVLWVLVVYALVYFVGSLCVRSGWGRGLVVDYISSKTGCFAQLERTRLNFDFKITVFELKVFADKEKTIKLFDAPTLSFGWGSLEARRINVLADFDASDRPFSSSLHKFATEEDFYKVEKLNAFSLSMFENLDNVKLYDISIILKMKGKTEEHFLTKFIKEPLDLPDENDIFYFVLGDNLRWITTSHGKIISTISGDGEKKSVETTNAEAVAEAPNAEPVVEESSVNTLTAEPAVEAPKVEPAAEEPKLETVTDAPSAEASNEEPIAEASNVESIVEASNVEPATEAPAPETK